ncbi:MAG TPA: transglycosylase domain-containing protein [Candidatus Lachnoclostridium stercoravium]|uniref:Penicillin-binding protein 1A n=1 Tax=Candidatus Lachnoclostridium stercoravium TaxID=2838633 RepID=A0A9D2HI30_9FIRM|nr:transglycosylase domain-containing protein [Candidatus Lachnoclostridium stercoravium]
MNYGKYATEQKIKSIQSRGRKYSSKLCFSLIKTLFVLCLFACLTCAGIGFGMIRGIIDDAPEINMESIVPSGYATTVYDSAGNLTDTLVKAGSNREEATYDELPEDLINAFVAIEDSRFWTHNGIDLRSITRAAVGLISGNYSGGGSTITQQLIKNNVLKGGSEKTWGARIERKLQEQYLAVQLTKSMDRKLILTNYLNTINLGNNTLGVKVAARRYFNKDVSELNLSECAVIAGITQNPAKLNPISGREENEKRRKVILQCMVDQGYITKEEQEEALADNVYDRIQTVDLATRESSTPYSYFTDELTKQVTEALKEKLGYSETQAYNLLYSGGLQIYTTQDPQIQAIVDEEVNNPENYATVEYSMEYRLSITHADGTTEHFSQENIKAYHKNELGDTGYDGLYDSTDAIQADVDAYKAWLLKEGDEIIGESLETVLQPQVSFVIMDQATGEVKAISGGRGEKTASLTLNRACDTLRQPGSAFKVITAFAPALDACGATLGTVYYDAPYTVGTKTFSNWYSRQGFLGYSSIREGIIYSMNIVAVRCFMETVTPQLGIEYAQNFGITTLVPEDVTPAAVLGGLTKGVTNLELTSAFASIANGGVYTKPVFFTKILDHNGKVLISNEPETKRVLKDSTAFLLTDAMAESMQSNRKFARSGVSVNSTSTRSALSNMSAAGKSGTTTANNDIWFVGYTPYYTAGVWGGYDNNQKLTNTSFHKDIWRKIMTRVHEGMSDPGFAVPDSIETAQICRKSGKLAVSGVCSADPRGNAVYTEYFAKGTAPTDVCSTHVRATICAESGMLPTPFCTEKTTGIFINIPSGETAATDDSVFALPGTCTVHSATGTIIDSESPGSSISPTGPGYVSGDAPTSSSGGSSGNTVAPKPDSSFHSYGDTESSEDIGAPVPEETDKNSQAAETLPSGSEETQPSTPETPRPSRPEGTRPPASYPDWYWEYLKNFFNQ